MSNQNLIKNSNAPDNLDRKFEEGIDVIKNELDERVSTTQRNTGEGVSMVGLGPNEGSHCSKQPPTNVLNKSPAIT